MKCSRCQHENRPQARFCEQCAGPLKGVSPVTRSHVDDLMAEVEGLRQALTHNPRVQPAAAPFTLPLPTTPAILRTTCSGSCLSSSAAIVSSPSRS